MDCVEREDAPEQDSALNEEEYQQLTEPWLTDNSFIIEEKGLHVNGWRLLRDYKLDELLNHLRDKKTGGIVDKHDSTSSELHHIKSNTSSVFVWLLLVFSFSILSFQLSQSAKLEVAEKHRFENTLNIRQLELQFSGFQGQVLGYIETLQNTVASLNSDISFLSSAVSDSQDSAVQLSGNILQTSNDWQERLRAVEARMNDFESFDVQVDQTEVALISSHVDELKRQLNHVWQTQQGELQQLEDKLNAFQSFSREMISQTPASGSFSSQHLINYAQNVFPVNCTHYYPSFLHYLTHSLSYSMRSSYVHILRPEKLLGESFAFDTKSGPCILEFELSQPLKVGTFEVAHHVGSPNSKNMIQDYSWEIWQQSEWTTVNRSTYNFHIETQAKQLLPFEVEEASSRFRIILHRTLSKDYTTVYTIRVLSDPLSEHG